MDLILIAKRDYEKYAMSKDDTEWKQILVNNKEFIGDYAQEISQ